MHEYSIAEGLVLTIKALKDKEGLTKVVEALIYVGSLAQVDREVLLETLRILGPEYGLEGVNYVIKEEESIFQCNYCGYVWPWSEVRMNVIKELCGDIEDCDNPIHLIPDLVNVFVKCPKCSSQDFKILTGYDVKLISIKGERDERL